MPSVVYAEGKTQPLGLLLQTPLLLTPLQQQQQQQQLLLLQQGS